MATLRGDICFRNLKQFFLDEPKFGRDSPLLEEIQIYTMYV
jgi:hypothetical protein